MNAAQWILLHNSQLIFLETTIFYLGMSTISGANFVGMSAGKRNEHDNARVEQEPHRRKEHKTKWTSIKSALDASFLLRDYATCTWKRSLSLVG